MLPVPHTVLWRGKDGKAEEKARGARRRLGATGDSVRLGRAEGVREDQAARTFRRSCPGARDGDRDVREDALPEDCGFRAGRHAEPVRLASRQEARTARLAAAPHRRPQGRTPRAQPQRDRQDLLRPLRKEAAPGDRARCPRRGAAAHQGFQALRALPRDRGGQGAQEGRRRAALRRVGGQVHSATSAWTAPPSTGC